MAVDSPLPGVVASLRAAVDTLRADPIGVLLPAGGALLVETGTVIAARHLPWLALGALVLARVVVVAALRSRIVAVAARARGWDAAPWGRPAAMIGVALIVTPLWAGVAAGVAAIGGLTTATIAAHGWYTTAAVVFAATVALATGLAVGIRALFVYAPAEVGVGGRSALGAVAASASRVSELGGSIALVLAGDLATAIGGLPCGAGALPGYPITDLAALRRWREGP